MGDREREVLGRIMARLGRGEEVAVFDLLTRFGAPVRATLAAIAGDRGHRHLRGDDLDALTVEACFVIGRRARGWRPDGALPWTWARHRLVNLVDDWAGARTGPWRDHGGEPGGEPGAGAVDHAPARAYTGPEPDVLDTLGRLARRNPRCALLLAALVEAVPLVDREVLLRYVQQQAAGDPSPSHTVAADLGLPPPVVRQRACRARRRLRRVVECDPRFAELAGISLLVPSAGADSARAHPARGVAKAA